MNYYNRENNINGKGNKVNKPIHTAKWNMESQQSNEIMMLIRKYKMARVHVRY